jgi:hypothetical protein
MSLDGTGIILEVERGKTTINNMDLLEFWKCHICAHADFLFLMVPLDLATDQRAGSTASPTVAPRQRSGSSGLRSTSSLAGSSTTTGSLRWQ